MPVLPDWESSSGQIVELPPIPARIIEDGKPSRKIDRSRPSLRLVLKPISVSLRYKRERFLGTIDSIEPKVREGLRSILREQQAGAPPNHQDVQHWMEEWNLSEPWIGEVAAASLQLWRDYPSIDRWELPFLVDRAFDNQEEFKVHAWNPVAQSADDYEHEVAWKLRNYIRWIEAAVRRAGLEPVRESRDRGHDHFLWLVQYQIKLKSFYAIGKANKLTPSPVSRAVHQLGASSLPP